MSATTPVSMDTPQVRNLLENNPRTRLIDVRGPGEFAAAHIPGSYNVPLDLLREHRSELTADHEDPIVLVCASGGRAEQARTVLERSGLDHLSVLDGGMTGWQQHDAPVNRGSGIWGMERQVRLTAGLLVLTGVVASTAYEPLKWLAGFVGGGLTFAAITNTCAMSRVLGLLPHNRTPKADAGTMLEALTGRRPEAAAS
ncbi:rhodanese-related sulfurtransferase [Halopolyspora algeriensis]|uniref:Rhodanese-related sulfurtransferase n=1 Tax=Halopolyspora algeriensis TaxID=1500506 RepID=A0A368VRU4_9ACTN|nr:rhodanese-like domain-containing protein [Halopolyspora algeriensis]RCW44461.1 rhodanese-related sulfurtransferase [Halopolyspora algeriensis]TQM55822.1 rhodanese-related sulfurtransferase [Halopolyspora algeriensis]